MKDQNGGGRSPEKDRPHIQISSEEHARSNAELRSRIAEERGETSKDKVRNWFTVILVLTGLFVLGGFVFMLLPAPLNYLAILAMGFAWVYLYES